MGLLVVIVIAAVVVVVGSSLIVLRKRRTPPQTVPATVEEAPKRAHLDETPMTGLESALDQITDRDGRTMRDRLDAEGGVVDDLRVPDDTGPLLRRALDEFADDTAANERPEPTSDAD